MKYNLFWLLMLISLAWSGAAIAQTVHSEMYRWVSFEQIVKDKRGKPMGKPAWGAPVRIKSRTVDTVTVYSRDSILMCFPSERRMFRKINLNDIKWKPKPSYDNQFFYAGIYVTADAPGMLFTFYFTKDKQQLLQLHYTNPANLNAAILFAKDSTNRLALHHVLIDPSDERSEAERPVIQ